MVPVLSPNHTKPSDIEVARARLDALARAAGRNPATITISVFGQPADRDLARRYHDAGAERVIVRPGTAKTEEEMGVELERIAGSVLR